MLFLSAVEDQTLVHRRDTQDVGGARHVEGHARGDDDLVFLGREPVLATGTRGFVGSAAGEAEICDANTGEVMAAGVGRLRGGLEFDTSFDNSIDTLCIKTVIV